MNNTWKTTWDCVWFGSYPQSEITSEDGDIYHELKNVTGWDENNDIVIGKAKYRRLKATEATNYATRTGETHPSYYNWKTDYNTYHYFKYEPIKWRVLNRDNNNNVFLVADISLDDQPYNVDYTNVTWENSSIRSWLNGYGNSENQPKRDYSQKNFINSAFSSEQISAIESTRVINNNNINYKTNGGNDTLDKVFLLQKQMSIIQMRHKNMDLTKKLKMLRKKEVTVVHMLMRWGQPDITIHIIYDIRKM